MAEAIGFAAMAELPLVVVDAMRPGPSTGMPTRTEQSDLQFAIHISQGEVPHIVLAPGDVQQCFEQGWRAFNLADRFQCPVLVLTDGQLATLRQSIDRDRLDPATASIDRGVLYERPVGAGLVPRFERYAPTPSGISPRSLPGTPDAVHLAASYEHDAAGHMDESAFGRVAQMDKRARKLASARDALGGPVWHGPPDADVTLVCWGSTTTACREAAAFGGARGQSINVLQFIDLWPLPVQPALAALRATRRVLLVEQNSTGQLGTLLRAETGVQLPGRLLQYDGRALDPETILDALPLATPLAETGG
jgi:2-oxoglutarate ferredoxin oxidoreductase subunit alpha